MDGRRFDTFTRLVASDVSRRGVIRGTLAALAGAMLGSARSVSGRAQGAELGCCRCYGAGSLPGCQSARDLGDCRQLCGRSGAAFDPVATCSGDGKTCQAQVDAAEDHGCCFCLKEPGRSRGCVNAEDLETCKVHCKKNPTDAGEALPPDADVDFNPNKICQPSEAGGKKYVCRTKAMAATAVRQYDPVAFVGNVALALPDLALTPLAFLFDPQQAVADGYFYGADPPAGWQGLARAVLYLPDPNGASGQGISQALYLKGHWFDTDDNAESWYGTGAPLLEASGNGRYLDQTGDAGFGDQRTVWGASFPTADDPEVTINRGIAWFRRGNVVLDATLDVYCAGGTASNVDAVARLAALVPGPAPATGTARKRTVTAASQGSDSWCDELDYLKSYFSFYSVLDDNLSAAETEQVVTRHLPLLAGTPVVNLDVTRWGGQTTGEFGASAEARASREAFGFGAEGHISGNYAGVDADGKPLAVFTNAWFVEAVEDALTLYEQLVAYVLANDERTGFERVDIPSVAASGDGYAMTANAFTIPREDGSKLGGAEVRAQIDNVVATAAVVESTPLPPETTPQDVAEAKQAALKGETRDALGLIMQWFAIGPLLGALPVVGSDSPEDDPDAAGKPPSPVGTPIDLDGA